jgi:hypothetical protein
MVATRGGDSTGTVLLTSTVVLSTEQRKRKEGEDKGKTPSNKVNAYETLTETPRNE